MSKNILVLGDSFATVDPVHGHWASMWAEQHGYSIRHLGYPGRDHLHIVNDFYNQQLFDSVDILIYQVTDFYRLQYQYPPISLVDVVSRLKDLSYLKNSSSIFLEKFANTHTLTTLPIYISKLDNFSAIETKIIQQLYSSISIDWLRSANFFIMRNLLLDCKLRNVPLVLVVDQHLISMNISSVDLFDEYENIFLPKVDELTIDETSINHVSEHGHKLALMSFNEFVQKKSLLDM